MTAITTTPTTSNSEPRKTLANQLDRLDGILDGLDAALAGAVQEVVEQAVKQAVQAVLTEVLTNRRLQEQLHPVIQPEETGGARSMPNRLWQATMEGVRRMLQSVKKVSRGVGMGLIAAGAVVAGLVYAARKKITVMAVDLYRSSKRLVQGPIWYMTRFLPSFTLGC